MRGWSSLSGTPLRAASLLQSEAEQGFSAPTGDPAASLRRGTGRGAVQPAPPATPRTQVRGRSVNTTPAGLRRPQARVGMAVHCDSEQVLRLLGVQVEGVPAEGLDLGFLPCGEVRSARFSIINHSHLGLPARLLLPRCFTTRKERVVLRPRSTTPVEVDFVSHSIFDSTIDPKSCTIKVCASCFCVGVCVVLSNCKRLTPTPHARLSFCTMLWPQYISQ